MEIIRGPLKGLRGTLYQERGIDKFILSVDLIRQVVACEVHADPLGLKEGDIRKEAKNIGDRGCFLSF